MLGKKYRECGHKHRFSQDRAIRLANRKREATGENIVAYPCRWCGEWHLGHGRTRRSRRLT